MTPRRRVHGVAVLAMLLGCSSKSERELSFTRTSLLPTAASQERRIMTGEIVTVSDPLTRATDILVAEPLLHRVSWLQHCETVCEVRLLDAGLIAPVRIRAVDLDSDGDRDWLIADIGNILPDPHPVGRVVVLDNIGDEQYRPRVLLDHVGRVACAEPADLDRDGDLDIVVCEFGLWDGTLRWLEQRDGAYVSHELRRVAGALQAWPLDVDQDGDLDLAVAISQTAQQVVLFRNLGGEFVEESLYAGENESLGLSSLTVLDLDRDGSLDLLFTAGDYLDGTFDITAHGVYALHNRGDGTFAPTRLARAVGAYAVRGSDFDDDGDIDLVLACMHVRDRVPDEALNAPALSWLENDGHGRFVSHAIHGTPAHLMNMELARIGARPAILLGSFTEFAAGPEDRRLEMLRVVGP